MPSLPQSNNLQEIQRAFLERDAELRRLVGDTKTAAAASVTGLRKTISSSRGTSGSTTPSGGTTATTVKGRRVITAVSTEALSFYETNYTQAEFTESADIISIETNHPAWVRVYSSAAARLEDASRLFSQPPVAGTGLMVEVLTFLPDDLLIYLSPVPFWNNCDTVLGKTAYIAVTRWDNDDPEILEMTFTILPQEEMDKNGSQGLLGPRGFTGDGYQTMGEWSGTETYLANDVVGRNGSVYCSLLNDNLNQDPATATTYWTLWAAKGSKGDPGEDGAPGTPGAAGADGANGSDGAAATVAVGTVTSGSSPSVTNSGTSSAAVLDFVLQKGDTGAAGADGVDGATVISGTSDPSSSTGKDGDFYINTTTHYLFGPKLSGGWPTGISLVGGNSDSYSTSETATNKTHIDGRRIYRRVYELGALPNNAQKNITHNLTNVTFVSVTGWAYDSGGNYVSLPFASPGTTDSIGLWCGYDGSTKQICIKSGMNRSGFTGYAVLEYVKN